METGHFLGIGYFFFLVINILGGSILSMKVPETKIGETGTHTHTQKHKTKRSECSINFICRLYATILLGHLLKMGYSHTVDTGICAIAICSYL